VSPREVGALLLGLLLIALGWQQPEGEAPAASPAVSAGPLAPAVAEPPEASPVGPAASEAIGPAAGDLAAAPSAVRTAAVLQRPEAPLARPVAVAPAPEEAPGAAAPGPPTLEPVPLPAAGLELVARAADGRPAAGAPLGVFVLGGRAPLVEGRAGDDGCVVLRHGAAVAPRYEVGLVAPGAPRVPWDGVAARIELDLPEAVTVEVRVLRAARPGVEVELGTGAGLAFLPVHRVSLEGDGYARFRWVPAGAEARVRVRYDEGLSEVPVTGGRATLAPPQL